MTRRFHVPITLALATLLAGPAIAQERPVYDTYIFGDEQPDRLVGTGQGLLNSLQYADPFVMTGGDGRLARLTVRLKTRQTGFEGTDVLVQLREDTAGFPGPVLESWVVANDTEDFTDFPLESLLDPLLFDGATYWVNVAAAEDAGFGAWAVAETNTLDWLFAFSRNEDPVWMEPAQNWALDDLGMALVEVPEPAPAALALMALLLFPALVTRKQLAAALRRQ